LVSFNKNQKWCNIIIYTRTLYPYTLLYSSHTFKYRRIIRPPISPLTTIPPHGRPNAIFYSPFEFHCKNLVAYIMTQMILTSARAVLPLKRLTVELYGYIWKPSVHIRAYICYSTPTRVPILKRGPVSKRRDLTPHRLSIRRRCRNSAIFAFYSLQQQHGRSSGIALSCTTNIPISRNRILTHVYKYLNAFIIHIYIRRRLLLSHLLSGPIQVERYHLHAHLQIHTHASTRVCHFDVTFVKRDEFSHYDERVHCIQRMCVCIVLIPNLRKNGTHRIF